jgi:MATE family multidrug resistance protein
MDFFNRLKRWVAPGRRADLRAGGRRLRPDAGTRLHGLVSRLLGGPRGRPGGGTMLELTQLAWPIAAGMLGETALGLCDTKLVGALGPAALAGVGVASILLFFGYAMVFGLMRSVKVRAAHAVGEGRPHDAVRYAEAGALIGLGFALVVFAATRDVTVALRWLGVDEAMVPYARDFVAARAWGAVGTCVGAALIQYLQGVGDTRTPMVIGLTGNLFNAGMAFALIHGHLGLPALGVRGAGYATATTELLELVALLWIVRRRAAAAPRPALGRVAALREVASLGVPTGVHFVMEVAAFTAFTAILGSMRPEEMAAHQIALNVMRASFLPGAAVAEAASVLVARALGRRSLAEADRVTRAALTLGVGFMSLCGIVFAVFGAALAAAFSPDPVVVAVARRLLLVAAVFQTLDAVNMILRGALRGAKDVRWVAVVGTTIAWVAIPGAALLLGRMAGLGALGGWIGFVVETTAASALFGWRWARGSWRARYGEAVEADEEEVAPLSVQPAG